MYLMIENPGIAPPEGFTLLGASTKGGDADLEYKGVRTIGSFGSGSKHAIALLMRHDLFPIVFSSNLRMEFLTREQPVEDGITTTNFRRLMVKYGGRDEQGTARSASEDLGFVLEYGKSDWKSVSLALREFVSNAIDHSIKYNKHNGNDRRLPWDGTRVELVGPDKVRARRGFTRVFVPAAAAVSEFYSQLGLWFLHFSQPNWLNQTILPKRGRNLSGRESAVIYRRGVRVREYMLGNKPSLFDYNLEALELDESRQVDDSRVHWEAARAFRDGLPEHLKRFWESFREGAEYWEHSFSNYALENDCNDSPDLVNQRRENWTQGFREAVGSDTILVQSDDSRERVSRRGFRSMRVPHQILSAGAGHGLQTEAAVLSEDERLGRTIMDATPIAVQVVDFIWGKVVRAGMNAGKERPAVRSFQQHMLGGTQVLGFYRDNTVFLHTDLDSPAAGTPSNLILNVALEEIAHHITGATDMSRDFQDWLIRFGVSFFSNQFRPVTSGWYFEGYNVQPTDFLMEFGRIYGRETRQAESRLWRASRAGDESGPTLDDVTQI